MHVKEIFTDFDSWLRRVSVAFSSCGEWGSSLSPCSGFSLWWLPLLRGTSSRVCRALVTAGPGLQSSGSVAVAHGCNCPSACGIFLDQGLNSRPAIGRQSLNHWTAREVLNAFSSEDGQPHPLTLLHVSVCRH